MRHLLPIFLPGFIVASLLISLFGDSGVLAYRRLERYRESLAANVEKLQAKNSSLKNELADLRDNPERSLVMAREIGLYRAGDEVVKIEGMTGQSSTYEMGDFIKLRRARTARNAVFKATGIGISGALAVLAILAARAQRKSRHGGTRD